jgi:DNA-binding LacI/PurR family transcriptional regulator
MASAVEFLADRGHRRVVYVSNAGDSRFSSSVERQTLFREALRARGARESEVEDSVVDVGTNRLPGAVASLCARTPRVCAFCCDTWLVELFIDCLHRSGRSVPDDVEVVSVGGVPCEVTVPAMITDTYEIGYRGALRLVGLMDDPHAHVGERVAPIGALVSAGDDYYRRGRSGGSRNGTRGKRRVASSTPGTPRPRT